MNELSDFILSFSSLEIFTVRDMEEESNRPKKLNNNIITYS